MRPDLQRRFNSGVSPESHAALKAGIENKLGLTIEFRICEMPIFISRELADEMSSAAKALVEECVRPENRARSAATLQDRFTVPSEAARPLFSVVDFAITLDENQTYRPRLIELQGFPSLFGYQHILAEAFIERYRLDGVTPFLSGIDQTRYAELLATSIFGSHDPAEVALVEINPDTQKTRPDFVAMEKLIGLQTVNIRDVVRHGKGLAFTDRSGRLRPLRRIFNRAIIDELDDLGVELNFSWNEELEVEWAGHPNWYFRISKFLLPYLTHATVPRSIVVSDSSAWNDDVLRRSVLKPLYAFAGKGVNVAPTMADIEAIPRDQLSEWILQERVHYAPCVPTPEGDNFVEIRIMLIWPDTEERPLPVMTLARTGRGAMMGARYNVSPWTGSSGCLIAP